MKRYESISILWGPRVESIEEISRKILVSLQFIMKQLPEIFEKWYKLGHSKEEAMNNNLIINTDNLKKMLESNADTKFPDLGTRISIWNGADKEEEEASCSARLNSDSSRIKNNFVLSFPVENNLSASEIKILIEFLNRTFNGESVKVNGEDVKDVL